ncbi:phosphoribosyltransferase family protein [Bacillus sp. JJ1773]|uniref:phosphoribosyltransferase family protein n=1 Tax=Bacillus sp. JJ1773 TaxID=3122965 RepID=UPI002FFE5C9D
MKNTLTSTCSPTKFTLPILNRLSVEIEITDNPYQLPIDELFIMAARINKKRSFLFVSKVLGKHIPIEPRMGMLTGALLANRYLEKVTFEKAGLREKLVSLFNNGSDSFAEQPFVGEHLNPVIIGFAETATALGHAFYQYFQKADFFHTTREKLVGLEPVITFEEEHSHATSHRCYIDESLLNNQREVILVDDEMTTGKTAINIIRSIQKQFPRDKYTVVSILDWRSEEDQLLYKELEEELKITIQSVSLLKGFMKAIGSPDIECRTPSPLSVASVSQTVEKIVLHDIFPEHTTAIHYSSISLEGKIKSIPYVKETGRFGINSVTNHEWNQSMEEVGRYLKNHRLGERTLCLGTGEFMYLPMIIASYMGNGVSYQSSTRSPIYVENRQSYGAAFGLSFPNPEDWKVDQFVYNIPPNEYDDLFVFFERAVSEEELKPFLNELKKTNIRDIKIVFFNGGLRDE